jgi:ribose transport system permease protein
VRLLLYRGLARFIADDETKGFGDAAGFETLQRLATGSLFTCRRRSSRSCVVSVVMWVVLHRSVYGGICRHRRNETAARYSGINAQPRRRERLRDPRGADRRGGDRVRVLHELDFAVVARQLLRAVRHRGGRARRLQPARRRGLGRRILLGTTLLQVLQNLVNLLGIPSSLNFAVMGGVILIGVVGDQVLQRRAPGGDADAPRCHETAGVIACRRETEENRMS